MSDGLVSSPAEVFEAFGRALQARLHTHLPGEVVTYDPVTNTATVRPMLKGSLFDRDGERTYETLPDMPAVPVVWPRGGGMVARLPLEAGDSVLLCFSEASLAEWRTTGQLSEPTDARRHSLGHAFAIPGAFPDVSPLSPLDAAEIAAGAAIIGTDGSATAQIIIGGTVPGVRIGKLAVSPVALSVPTDAALSTCVAAINAVIGTLNALVTAYNAHVHPVPGVTVGPGATTSSVTTSTVSAAAAGPGVPATTASAVTKSL